MSQDKPADRKDWEAPEIVEVGGVAEVTMAGPEGNVRDNQGDATPKYKVFTRTAERSEAELPDGD